MPGSTLRQERYAALIDDTTIKTKTELAIRAGYDEKSARKNTSAIMASKGVQHAREQIQAKQRDRVRGIAGLAERALSDGAERLGELDARDLIAAGAKLTELAATLGQDVEQRGDGSSAKHRRARAIAFAYLLGWKARDLPLEVVLSQLADWRQRK